MNKSLIVFILLSGFAGCGRSDLSVSVQNKQSKGQTPKTDSNPTVIDKEAIIEHIYQTIALGRSSPGTTTKAPERTAEPGEIKESEKTAESLVKEELKRTAKPVATEKPKESEDSQEVKEAVAPASIKYISKKDGFSVLMPTAPTLMNMDPTSSIHLRLYQTKVRDDLVQYNVFCHFFDKKILSNETIRTYLDGNMPDRLVGFDKGQIIRKTLTKFRGFDAKEFEYQAAQGDTEFIYKGLAFLIDGDSISLTMLYPKETDPALTFDEFTESFELLPLEPFLSSEHWIDERLKLRFTPPADMLKLNQETSRKGLIVMFACETGHTIGILDATVAYPGITWPDIQSQLSEMKDCGDGFYENIITIATTNLPMVQLLRCVHTDRTIYLIQAYAPQKTYFRSVPTFKAAMKSFSFGN